MNPFIINCLHLANDSYCKHLISDIFQYSVAQVSHVTCSKEFFKSCSKMLILKFSL